MIPREAKWIWPSEAGRQNAYALFEAPFVPLKAAGIKACVSVSGDYALFINGRLAGFGQYSDWPDEKSIDTWDISQYCHEGTNQMRLTAWHQGLDCLVGVSGEPGAMFWVEENGLPLYASGERTPCATCACYQNGPMTKITQQLGYSFRYDANRESGPHGQASLTRPPLKTRPRPVRPMVTEGICTGTLRAQGTYRDTQQASPAEMMQSAVLTFIPAGQMTLADGWFEAQGGDGIYLIYDLGRESVGWFTLDAEFEAQAEVKIAWGEHLSELRVRSAIADRRFCAEYRARPGRNRFTHHFRRWGCRYLQLHISAKRARIRQCGLTLVSYPLNQEGAFPFADARHREIYETAVHTLKCCVHAHYEDCPWREQALYAMDSRIQMLCGYYAFREYSMPRASLELLAGGLRDDGLLELCASGKADITIPAFSLVYVVALWEYALYSGDLLFAQEQLPGALTILDSFDKRLDPSGCLPRFQGAKYWNFHEWQPGLQGEDMEGLDPGIQVLDGPLTAWYAIALEAAACLCEQVGQKVEARERRARKGRSLPALEQFWDEDQGLYAAYISQGKGILNSELMQHLVMLAGACPKERAFTLRRKAAACENMISVTLSNTLLRYQSLLAEEETYADFVFDEIKSLWGKMLDEGATAFWETLLGDKDFDGAGSLCHGWSAVPAYIYHAWGLGVRPENPGVLKRYPVCQTRLGIPGTEFNAGSALEEAGSAVPR